MSLLQQSQTLGHPVKAAKSGLLLGERRLGTMTPTKEAGPMIDGCYRPFIICAAHNEPLNQMLIVSPTGFLG
ncbi:MAG: hypothetical protein Q7O12_16470 [Deltaproteobacteria bacterium]|nr:hypothetical protein [Deltaproteobacteria bacterium]